MARGAVLAILGGALASSAILGAACSFPDFTTTSWSSGAGGSGSGAGGTSTSSASTGGSTSQSSGTGGSPPTCDAGVPLCEGGACSCDCDGDGQLSAACEPDPAKADCNDAVKLAQHGQMTCSSSPVVPGTMDFDWNCDGSSTFCFTDVVNCLLDTPPCDTTEKWKGPAIPACGTTAPTANCVLAGVTCQQADVGMRPQTCL